MSGKSIFSKGDAKPSTSHDEINAFLGKETLFEGKITFRGAFRLDGKFEGEIFDGGTLIVGETALIKGKIEVNTIIINGCVEGELRAVERVEIHPSGKFTGTLITPVLIINEGGMLNGHCEMGKTSSQKEGIHPDLPKLNSTLSVS